MRQGNALTPYGKGVILLLFLVLASPLPVFAVAQLRLQMSEQVAPGDVATVQVSLNDGEGIGNLTLTIGYNAELLAEPQVIPGELGSGASITSSVEQPGTLRVQITNPQGISGSGQLLDLVFETAPTLTTSLPLSLTAQGFNLEEQPIPLRTLGTTLAVLPPTDPAAVQTADQDEEEEEEPAEGQQERQRIARAIPLRRERPSSSTIPSPTSPQQAEGAIRFAQEPEIVLSDGEEIVTVKVTFDRKGAKGGAAPALSYSLLNGELIRKPVVKDQNVEFKILPLPGTTKTVLYILGQEALQPIELQVFPPVDIDFDRSGVLDDHLYRLLMQQMGKRVGKDQELRRYDLNRDGIIDDSDVAVFSANYSKKRQKK